MMPNDDVWGEVIQKLIKDSESGMVRWKSLSTADPTQWIQHSGLRGFEVVGEIAWCLVEGHRIRIYEYEYPTSDNDDQPYTARDVAVEFFSKNGQLLWEFPRHPSRWTLIGTVRYQLSNAGDFLERYLKAS